MDDELTQRRKYSSPESLAQSIVPEQNILSGFGAADWQKDDDELG